MRAIIQRTKHSSVWVDGQVIGEIDDGLVVLLGITHEDTKVDMDVFINKLIKLRIFEDADGKMNESLQDRNGSVLSISQFTLYANVKKGNRPSFTDAAKPSEAESLYNYFNESLRAHDIPVETGQFGAMMDVRIQNDGPVTIIMEVVDGKIVN